MPSNEDHYRDVSPRPYHWHDDDPVDTPVQTFAHGTGPGEQLPKIIEVGGAICFISLFALVPGFVVSGITLFLISGQFGVLHWSLDLVASLAGIIGFLGLIGFVLGLLMCIVGAPFVLIRLLFKLLAMPFRSQEQKEQDALNRRYRRRQREKGKASREKALRERKNKRAARSKRPLTR